MTDASPRPLSPRHDIPIIINDVRVVPGEALQGRIIPMPPDMEVPQHGTLDLVPRNYLPTIPRRSTPPTSAASVEPSLPKKPIVSLYGQEERKMERSTGLSEVLGPENIAKSNNIPIQPVPISIPEPKEEVREEPVRTVLPPPPYLSVPPPSLPPPSYSSSIPPPYVHQQLPPNPQNRFANLPPAEISRLRAEYRLRFQLLKKRKNFVAPEIDFEKEPLENIDYIYQRSVRYIHAEYTASSQYILYLIAFWLLMELMMTKMMGLKAGGFTLFQLRQKKHYERLLIEIGEEMGGIGDSFSPWIRIIIMSGFNALVFVLINSVASDGANGTAEAISNVIAGFLNDDGPMQDPGDPNAKEEESNFDLGSIAKVVLGLVGGKGLGSASASASTSNAPREKRNFRPKYTE